MAMGPGSYTAGSGIPDPDETYDQFKWGGRGRRRDATGNFVDGSSGADVDVARYEQQARDAYNRAAPNLDRTQSTEARGYQSNALGLMQNAAYGGAPSAAELYGQPMADDSIDAAMSVAASSRGGPLAQAAAMQQAQTASAQQRAAGARDLAALRADEMARARGDYYGAAAGMRGQDMAGEQYATDNDFRQRQLNSQDRQFYEQMGWNTRKQEQDAALQREQIGNQAWYQGRQATMQDEENEWGKIGDIASGAASFVGGIFSDVRAKEDIFPVSGGIVREDPYASSSLPVRADPYVPTSTPAPIATAFGDVGRDAAAAEPTGPSAFQVGVGSFSRGLSAFGKRSGARRAFAPVHSDARTKYVVSDSTAKTRTPFANVGHGAGASVGGGIGGGGVSYGGHFGGGAEAARGGGMNAMSGQEWNNSELRGMGRGASFSKVGFGGGMMSDTRAKQAYRPVHPDAGAQYIVSDERAKREAFEEGAKYADAQHAGVDVKAPAYAISKPEAAPPPQSSTMQAIIDHPATQAMARGAGLVLGGPFYMGALEGAKAGQQYAQARADGGPITAGQPYLVGERGPELVVPNADGVVVPAEHTQYVIDLDDPAQAYGVDLDDVSMRDGASDERTYNFDKSFHRDTPADQKRVKRSVEDKAGRDADEMMAGMRASLARGASVDDPIKSANRSQIGSAYTYKPGFAPDQEPGELNVGPMAQNMAADPIASTAVKQDPSTGYLVLDSAKLDKIQSTGIASLQQQVDELEARLRRSRR